MPSLLKPTFASPKPLSSSSSSTTPEVATPSPPPSPTAASTLLHGRYIPEQKRGWKYEDFAPPTPSSSFLRNRTKASPPAAHSQPRRKRTAGSRHQVRPSAVQTGLASSSSASAPSSIISPKASASASGAPLTPPPSPPPTHTTAGPTAPHPDDLVYPTTYPWRPSSSSTGASTSYIPPTHRNPSAKQAFYDTHFGASSGWNGTVARFSTSLFRRNKERARAYDDAVAEGAEPNGFTVGMSMEHAARACETVEEAPHDPAQSDLQRSSTDDGTATGAATDRAKRRSTAILLPSATWKSVMGAWELFTSHSGGGPTVPPLSPSPAAATEALLEPQLLPVVHRRPGASELVHSVTGNVVILGGYRGSVLRSTATDQRLWIPIKVGVGLRKASLELGLDETAETDSEETVYTSDMVTHIGRLVDMGKRLKHRLSNPHNRVYTWGYDWRLSLPLSARRLVAFLTELYEASSEDPEERRGAKVVAHSMGGLVALYALATCDEPRIFSGLVFAATPFQGTPNILGPLRYGDAALFNDTICSPRATFSFRSSFYLLPKDGRCFFVPDEGSDLNQEEQQEGKGEGEGGTWKDLDFLHPDTWKKYGFSPCVPTSAFEGGKHGESHDIDAPTTTSPSSDDPTTYLTRTLTSVRDFHRVLSTSFLPSKSHLYPPIALLASGSTPSVNGAIVGLASPSHWETDVRNGNYAHMSYAPGDGLITRSSATTLPGEWGRLLVTREEVQPRKGEVEMRLSGKGIVESGHRHVTLLSDVKGVAVALEAVERARRYREGRMERPEESGM
ncbi:hypothetical protein ACQY0O_001169 [Thecaphora frezii]